jgi:anti-sigma factor RsiW
MNLAVQHLSDEAITAFADGMLGVGPCSRATRHIEFCPECARAVAEQRAAVCALRAAPAPAVPVGLLERLRAVPSTTPLTDAPPMSLAPDGSAVFLAYGSVFPSLHASSSVLGAPRRVGRRTQQLARVTAAAAMLTMGVAASAAASTGAGRAPNLTPAGATVQPVLYPGARKQPAEVFGLVTANSHP